MAHWKKRETVFAEYGLGITLPGAWQLRPQEDPERWLYRSADHKENLTIRRRPMEGRPGEEAAEVRKALLKNRHAAELGFKRLGGLEIDDPEYGERVGVPAGWYHGSAGGGEHLFWGLVLGSRDAVWSFIYEAFRLPRDKAHEHIRATVATMSLRG